MKKFIICSIPMKEKVDQVVYTSEDLSLPVSERAVRYPVCAFLEKTLKIEDELQVLLLVKKDEYSCFEQNRFHFMQELKEVNTRIGAKINYITIDTDFSQDRTVHEQLMGKIVNEIDVGSHILVDITFGSKDLPIVIFAALGFAEKFLNCEIDHIIYGQASFVKGKAVNTKICDMVPLYYLSSVTNTIRCTGPDKAKQMLKSLLSL